MNSSKEKRNKEKEALSLQIVLDVEKLTKQNHTGIFILKNPFIMLNSGMQSAIGLVEKKIQNNINVLFVLTLNPSMNKKLALRDFKENK